MRTSYSLIFTDRTPALPYDRGVLEYCVTLPLMVASPFVGTICIKFVESTLFDSESVISSATFAWSEVFAKSGMSTVFK
jgi:hypothetical protein